MGNQSSQNFDSHFFTYFTLFWILLGWLGFILAILGIFQTWIFGTYLLLGLVFFLYVIFSRKLFARISRELKCIGLLSLAIVIVFSFFTTPTIFSGRDQGAISEASIRLAQNHQLAFSTPASAEFFKIYGPGRALNFPGFHYQDDGRLITQFPIPYIAWLGIFYALFGFPGLLIANAILFYLFLLSFYLIGKTFLDRKGWAALLILTLTSFSFGWFLKFTLSENMALALVWLGILQLILYFRKKEPLFFLATFFTFGLLAFSRIEGMAIFVIFAATLIFNEESRKFLLDEKIKHLYLPLLFLAAISIITISVNFPFFKEVGKAILKNPGLISNNDSSLTTLNIFYAYGLLPFVLCGLLGIAYFLKKKNYLALLPLLLVLPIFFYLLNPHISRDHPWLLRRFVFAVLPALIFYTVYFLSATLKNKKTFSFPAVIFLLLLLNLPAFGKYFTFSENPDLLAQTKKLSQKFSATDLVLVDRLASGDGFAMMSGPLNFLYGQNAVYFFNPDDFAKLDASRFDKIYLMAPDANIEFYRNSPLGSRLKNSENYSILTKRLELTDPLTARSKIKEVRITGKIFEIEK